jgi:hypothetical protein
MAEGRERVPWATMAAILVIARRCEPSSELHIAEDWYRRTALSDLLGVAEERVNDDRLYRALDQLLPHKQALEAHLKQRLGELFALDYDLLLYDVTSTYFEGEAAANPLAQRGHSRDHRGDCKQVCIGLVVTRAGIPLGYEVFAGNRHDVTTVEQIVGTMEARYGQAGRIWVMDRGMTSAGTVAWLQATGRRYLIGASKSELKNLAPHVVDARDWRQVRDGVEAKLCTGPDGNETFVLVRSAERRAKERAMHARFCERIETALVRLAGRLERARTPVDRGATERQIGRLLGRNSRAAGRYAIRLIEDTAVAAGFRLEWSARAEWDEWSRHSEGCYVLRTNVSDWTPEALWRTYYTPPEVPTRLGISCHQRPAFHRPAERLCHGSVEVGNEALDPLLEVLLGREVAAAEELADQDREPDLDLIDPRGVLGREVESDPVTGIAQERLACCHRLEDAGLSLLPEILLDTAKLRHEAGDPFGHVGIEVVADDLPRRRRRRRGEQILQERHEIRFGAGISDRATDLAGGDVERADQGFRAMPDVLELPPLDVSRLHRQALGGSFQGLDAGHLVDRDGLHALLGGGGGRLIHRADIGALRVEVGIRLGCQPVTVAVRLEIGLFFKNRPTEPCEMLLTMPRATDCRASSL